ncbi:hypothetical protein [Asaia sp. HumB]|uniref:hypothetical protein n=1 Tax=Asaia sp. HumB TaxID=3035475 RepID=UPI0025576555|nr:hypothetical protein [Asaia sp. HumB]MDL2169592.1 hypothetical protein [Asaia sp. HumB]
MSGKWAPGPWKVALTNPRWIMNRNNIIAEIEDEIRGRHAKEQMAANARLIAAAPELAEALEDLVSEFGCTLELLDRNGPSLTCADGEFIHASAFYDRREALDRARAALAKAKGEGA